MIVTSIRSSCYKKNIENENANNKYACYLLLVSITLVLQILLFPTPKIQLTDPTDIHVARCFNSAIVSKMAGYLTRHTSVGCHEPATGIGGALQPQQSLSPVRVEIEQFMEQIEEWFKAFGSCPWNERCNTDV
jgi:hypothetical protein